MPRLGCTPLPQRLLLIDALKGLAALSIVLHHLVAYGPLAAAIETHWPQLAAVLFDYGRIAVQVFLVMGGFLAARGLSAAPPLAPFGLIAQRYLRLVLPFMVAIGLSMICAAIADHWMDDEAIPDRATLGQWLAHATLLHGVLGVESLSAGVWYVAIDFQLFAVLALLLWLGRTPGVGRILVALTACLSLFWFNREAGLDNWAPYFFAAYGMGALAWWFGRHRQGVMFLGLLLTTVVAGLVFDFRLRIAVALATALLLAFAHRHGILTRWPRHPLLQRLGNISYALFLVHFPLCLLVNAGFDQLPDAGAGATVLAVLLALTVSLLLANLFHAKVEKPLAKIRFTSLSLFGLRQSWPVWTQVRRLLGLKA